MTPRRALLTISSINYLGQVTTLMRSARAQEVRSARFVVLVDRRQPVSGWDESLATILWVEDLLGAAISRAAFIFNVLELNTNVKPAALAHLCETFEQVAYLDPDTELFAPLDPAWEALEQDDIALTPHMLRPPTDEGKPCETDLMRYGSFNLGFVAVRAGEATNRFLAWWSRGCLTRGFGSPQDGLYVDQKFVDLAPAYFPGVHVLRHPGLNVAYWNLHERTIADEGGRWRVDGQPLIFMHFSGFVFKPSAERMHLISKYPSRVNLADRPELRPLFDGYRERLAGNGFEIFVRTPYSFATFSDGTPINVLARRIVATAVPAAADVGDYFRAGGAVHEYCRRARLLDSASRQAGECGASPENDRKLAMGRKVFRFLLRTLGPGRYLQLLRFCEEVGSTLRQNFLVERIDLGDRA